VLVVETAWFPNVNDVGARLAAPGGTIPVPVKLVVWGLLPALSSTSSVALLVPLVGGVKVTLTAQAAFGARLEPQSFVSAKSPLSTPVMAMLEMVSVVLPELESTIVWAALVVEIGWFENATEPRDRPTVCRTILVTKRSSN